MTLSAWVQLEHAPLVLLALGEVVEEVVPIRTSLQLGAFWSPTAGVGVGLSVPLYLMTSGWEIYPVPTFALGDARLTGLFRIGTFGPFTLGAYADLYLPSGTPGALVGEGGPRVGPGLVGRLTAWGIEMEGALGPLFRAPVETGFGLDVGTELRGRLSLGNADRSSLLRFMGALEVAWPLPGPRLLGPAPVLLLGGAELRPGGDAFTLSLAMGTAFSTGYGAADVRALFGVSFTLEFSDRPPDPEFLARSQPDAAPVVPLEALLDLPAELEEHVPYRAPPLAEAQPCEPLGPPIFFAQGRAELSPEAAQALTAIAKGLGTQARILDVIIEGHASVEGDPNANWALSQARATAVYRHLVDAGISPARLALRGLGEADRRGRRSAAVRDQDRRVELCVARALDPLAPLPEWVEGPTFVPWSDRTTDPEEEAR